MSTKLEILKAATKLAEDIGFMRLSYVGVASRLTLGVGAVQYNFTSTDILKNAVIEYALHTENLKILAQALVMEHPRLDSVSKRLINLIVKYLKRKNA